MKKIGLMSDTHSHLDEKVFTYFKDVDEIWHAGDVGDVKVIDELRKFKPLRGVYGNIDDHIVRTEFPEFNRFTCEKVNVLITHIGGRPGKYIPAAKAAIEEEKTDLFICGHSHILLVKMDTKHKMLCMNPGACGNKGFHKIKTLLRFSITEDKIHDLEAIEIGTRNSPPRL